MENPDEEIPRDVIDHVIVQVECSQLQWLRWHGFHEFLETYLCIDVPDFFSGRGSKRPPRISKNLFREGVQGGQGVNRR